MADMAGAEAIDLNQVCGRESEHGGHDERQDQEEDRRRGSRFGAGTGDERHGWRVGQGDDVAAGSGTFTGGRQCAYVWVQASAVAKSGVAQERLLGKSV